MVVTLIVLGLVNAVAVVGAAAAAYPEGERGRRRDAARRRRFVEQNPTHATPHDIRTQLVRDGVDPSQARFITDKAAEAGIKPFTMWLWIEQFDAEALGIVVAADLSHRDLLTHLSHGTGPDHEELKVFAAANGLVIADPAVRVPRRGRLDPGDLARRRAPFPTVHEPES